MRALRRRHSVVLIECAAAAVLAAALARAAGARSSGSSVRATRTETLLAGPAAERPLALALVDESRLLAVTASEVRLFRMAEAGAVLLAHVSLPGPRHAVRAPAALIELDASGVAAWVLSNQDEKAHLVDLDRLGLTADAESLPWPGSLSGLRYRDGTDWIEGDLEGIGAGPFLAIARGDGLVAVSTNGLLLAQRADATREEGDLTVGPMIAPLWPGVVATSTAKPPGARDTILILEHDHSTLEVVGGIPVDGAVRALASRVVNPEAWLVASIETGSGYEVLRLRLEGTGP